MTRTLIENQRRRTRRRRRVRGKVLGSADRPRLAVYRSNRGMFAQLIDDERGHTIVSVAWIEPELRELPPKDRAARAGAVLAGRAVEAGIDRCVFDRSGYKYHGQVKALADGARSAGLRF